MKNIFMKGCRIMVAGVISCMVAVAAMENAGSKVETNMLFIGNSFTMRHELPTLVAALAMESAPGSKMNTETVGYGGRTLFHHWECFRSYDRLTITDASESDKAKQIEQLNTLLAMKSAPDFYVNFWDELGANPFYIKYTAKKDKAGWSADQALIKGAISKHNSWIKNKSSLSAKFDYVVLQSWQDVTDDPRSGYFKYAAKFAEIAQTHGAKPVLYLTAPYAHNAAPTSKAVAKEQAVGECRAAFDFAKTLGAITVPVPLAITLAQESTAPVARTLTFRYQNDFHPNNTMAYLTACTMYAAMVGKSPEGLKFNKVTENKLQNIHGEAVSADDKKAALSDLVNPDGGPLETIFTDEERLFLQKTAWEAVQKFTSGNF